MVLWSAQSIKTMIDRVNCQRPSQLLSAYGGRLNMRNGCFIAAAICVLGLLDPAHDAFAQKPYRRYAPPAGPTITPYLNYFRQDTGGVGDPYNAFIAPRRQLDSQLSMLAQQQQADERATQQQLGQLRQAVAAPTGTSASHMNFSHYYKMPASVAKGRSRK